MMSDCVGRLRSLCCCCHVVWTVYITVAMVIVQTAANTPVNTTARSPLMRRMLRGYEKIPPPGGVVVVQLGVYINYIYAISEQSMDYSLSMYLRQRWNDSRLAFRLSDNNNNPKLKVADHMLDKIWVPDTFFRNEKTALFHKITAPNRLMFISSEGTVWYVTKITVTLLCPMLLHKYPLDTQGCPMVFSSFDHTLETLELQWLDKTRAVEFDPGGKDDSQFIINEFVLQSCNYSNYQEHPPGSVPCVEGLLVVSRSLGYFLIQFYIPSVLLVILSWVSFWISVDAVVARVNIGLLTVLTLTTQSTGSRDQLPRVSYIKAIDIWMSTCLVFAFASLIEFAIVNVWSRREARSQATKTRRSELAAKRTAATAATTTPGPSTGPSPVSTGPTLGGKPGVKSGMTAGMTGGQPVSNEHKTDNKQPAIPLQQVSSRSSPKMLSVPGQDQPTPATPGEHRAGEHRVSLTRRLSFQLPHAPKPVERASSIDRVSRVIFPASFLAFNLVYWLVYTL